MTTRKRCSLEDKERVAMMLFKPQGKYEFQWTAMNSTAEKIGIATETPREWSGRAEINQGYAATEPPLYK